MAKKQRENRAILWLKEKKGELVWELTWLACDVGLAILVGTLTSRKLADNQTSLTLRNLHKAGFIKLMKPSENGEFIEATFEECAEAVQQYYFNK